MRGMKGRRRRGLSGDGLLRENIRRAEDEERRSKHGGGRSPRFEMGFEVGLKARYSGGVPPLWAQALEDPPAQPALSCS